MPSDANCVFPTDTSAEAIDERRERVAPVLSRSLEELRELVPTGSGGLCFVDCPNCDHGTQDRAPWEWSPERPDRVTCGGCGETYPDNPRYPDDEVVTVEAPDGHHRFPYYERDDGYPLFFAARAAYDRRAWLADRVRDLGDLYAATGDETAARYAGTILDAFARVVPGWAYSYDYPFREPRFSPYYDDRIEDVPAFRTSLWTWWAYNDVPVDALAGYEAIRNWDGLASVGSGDVRDRIESDFFAYIVSFVLGFEDPLSNMSPRVMRDAIRAARVLERPAWVHEAMDRFDRLVGDRFRYDGQWFEPSPSYHRMTVTGLRAVADAAAGYTDPSGYRDPETGARFDDLAVDADYPRFGLADGIDRRVRFPDGAYIPVNDTWATAGRRARQRDHDGAGTASPPAAFGGLGLATLGGDTDGGRWLAYLNASSGTNHKHRDALSIGLYDRGRELLSDIGYTHTKYRAAWAASTMSHNTVVVDGQDSSFDDAYRDTRLRAVAGDERTFQVATAESAAAYPDATDRYRRTLAAVAPSSADRYLVDVFEVAGGDQHDFLLHGSADEDATAEIPDVALDPYDGRLMNDDVEFVEPTGEQDRIAGGAGAYGLMRDVRRGVADGTATVEMRLDEAPDTGTRTLVAPVDDLELFLARSPSVRRAGEDDANVTDHWMPSLIARRSGTELSTTFVAAHEAVSGEPRLQGLSAVHDDAATCVRVRHEHGVDLVVLSRAGTPVDTTFDTEDGTFGVAGRYALVRLDSDGRLRDGRAIGCREVSFRGQRVEPTPGWTGDVTAAAAVDAGDANGRLTVDQPIGDEHTGTIALRFPDDTCQLYTVTGTRQRGDATDVFVRETPGFRVDGDEIDQTAHPHRTIAGSTVAFELLASQRISPGAL